MQQPPLSQQLKVMERELDVRLLRRKLRGVELTDAGRALLVDARAMCAHLDRAVDATRRAARGEQGRLCVALTSTTPFHPLVPRAIRAFREACPMVSLTVEERLSNASINRLRTQSIDAAFIRTSLSELRELVAYPLLEEPMVAALAVSINDVLWIGKAPWASMLVKDWEQWYRATSQVPPASS